jgi:hypothetical protein
VKVVEREMHEAWRQGYEEGRRELAQSVVPEIATARCGPEVQETAKALVTLTNDDRLAELIVRAAICTGFDSFYVRAVSPKRKRRR